MHGPSFVQDQIKDYPELEWGGMRGREATLMYRLPETGSGSNAGDIV